MVARTGAVGRLSRAAIGLPLLVALAGCAAPPTPGLVVAPVRPAASVSAAGAGCLIPGRVWELRDGLPLYDSQRLDKPFARLINDVPITVSGLPPAREQPAPPVVRVDAGGNKLLRITGWTALDKLAFVARKRVDIVPGHIWMRDGTRVQVLGNEGSNVAVRVHTGFVEPGELDAFTTCDNLEYVSPGLSCDRDRAPPGSQLLAPRKPSIALHRAPGGQSIAVLGMTPDFPLPAVERRAGWVRLVIDRAGGLVADAWVAEREVVARTEPLDRETCCGTDSVDRCPDDPRFFGHVSADAGIVIGRDPGDGVRAVAAAGATLRLRERRGEHIAFDLPNGEIVAADGAKFWIHQRDVLVPPVWTPPAQLDHDGCPEF